MVEGLKRATNPRQKSRELKNRSTTEKLPGQQNHQRTPKDKEPSLVALEIIPTIQYNMDVTITINIPGQPVHHYSINATDAKAEAQTMQQERDNTTGTTATTTNSTNDTTTTEPPASKKRKTGSTNGLVASSVADRAQGPGIDPNSRFSYVYTGKHDHGTLEPESERRKSEKWSGLSDAMNHMKKHCDQHLTLLLKQEAEAAKGTSTTSSSSSSSSSALTSNTKK